MHKQRNKFIIGFAAMAIFCCAACGSAKSETATEAESTSAAEETGSSGAVEENSTAVSSQEETGTAGSASSESILSTWTAEGNFIDAQENHLIVYHMLEENGYDEEGWSVTLLKDEDMIGGELQEENGTLTGAFVSLDEEGNVVEEGTATLTAEGEGVLLRMEDGTEYHFFPDETDYTVEGEMLPFFQYNEIYGTNGWDPIEAAAYDYLAYDKMKDYDPDHTVIPYVQIVEVDETDPDDVRIYGDYWLFEMEKQGDTLTIVSGGNYPGIIHAERFGEGEAASYSAYSMEDALTEDQTKELLGEYYDQYLEVASDDETREAKIAQIIAEYVHTNDLDVTKYYIGGEEPQEIP